MELNVTMVTGNDGEDVVISTSRVCLSTGNLKLPDLNIRCRQVVFHVHSCLLRRRSVYFERRLSNPWSAVGSLNEVVFTTTPPTLTGLKLTLRYLYGESLQVPNVKELVEFMEAADFLQVFLEWRYFVNCITRRNCFVLLDASYKFNHHSIVDCMYEYIAEHFYFLAKTQSYRDTSHYHKTKIATKLKSERSRFKKSVIVCTSAYTTIDTNGVKRNLEYFYDDVTNQWYNLPLTYYITPCDEKYSPFPHDDIICECYGKEYSYNVYKYIDKNGIVMFIARNNSRDKQWTEYFLPLPITTVSALSCLSVQHLKEIGGCIFMVIENHQPRLQNVLKIQIQTQDDEHTFKCNYMLPWQLAAVHLLQEDPNVFLLTQSSDNSLRLYRNESGCGQIQEICETTLPATTTLTSDRITIANNKIYLLDSNNSEAVLYFNISSTPCWGCVKYPPSVEKAKYMTSLRQERIARDSVDYSRTARKYSFSEQHMDSKPALLKCLLRIVRLIIGQLAHSNL
uniref:Uncharacterized protein LOC100371014 n=1 Tax=Saccoglossus kowalevskii TaxID=10224 RepID=A0ABM0GUT9_SACKO|nr:PREDICTED: uncharacterized protein LOC100371014 [Saccoglossus kowalevskii]